MLFGIILLAAGIHFSIEHLTSSLEPAHAFAFGGGVSLYLVGAAVFRKVSGIPAVSYRYIAACLAVLTGFNGNNLYAGLQFVGLILVVLILAESSWVRAQQSE